MPNAMGVGAACLVLGVLAGAGAALALTRPKLLAARRTATAARAQLDAASAAQVELAEVRSQLSSLRHDLRGILSPTLLVADRLTSSADPGIRRAGDVMVRTVERATARLAEHKGVPAAAACQDSPNRAQP